MITRLRRRFAWWLLSFDRHADSVFIPFSQVIPWTACEPTMTTSNSTGRAIYVHSGQKVPCA